MANGPEAETAMVPVALGMVIVLLVVDGVAKVKLLVMLAFVLVKLVIAPCRVRFWVVEPMVRLLPVVEVMLLTAKLPLMVTVVPLSVMMESPMALLLVNLASLLVTPPAVVTLPPTPTQLPAVVHRS